MLLCLPVFQCRVFVCRLVAVLWVGVSWCEFCFHFSSSSFLCVITFITTTTTTTTTTITTNSPVVVVTFPRVFEPGSCYVSKANERVCWPVVSLRCGVSVRVMVRSVVLKAAAVVVLAAFLSDGGSLRVRCCGSVDVRCEKLKLKAFVPSGCHGPTACCLLPIPMWRVQS